MNFQIDEVGRIDRELIIYQMVMGMRARANEELVPVRLVVVIGRFELGTDIYELRREFLPSVDMYQQVYDWVLEITEEGVTSFRAEIQYNCDGNEE